jgi:transposase
MTLSIAAGIDAGQRFFDLGLAPAGTAFRFPNSPAGIAAAIARLHETGVQRVVLEAIGGYAQCLVEALACAGFHVGIVNPRRIKAFRDAEGRRAKTDRLDAKLIARFALLMPNDLRPLPSPDAQALKALAARRRQLTEFIAVEKTRLKQAVEPLVLASCRRAIEALGEECAAIESELARRIHAEPLLARTLAILRTIPGIGTRIATLLVVDLPELGSIDRKAIASLAGLAPHVSQSGNAPPRAAISGGRPCVRAALYMAALVAVRHDARFKADYLDLKSRGKPAKLALIAVARKLLVTANALVRDGQTYVIVDRAT